MEIKRIKYPSEDFYKFGSGEDAVSILDDEIEDWVNQTVNQVKSQLENGVESPYAYVASGNTLVFCFYNQEKDNVFDDDNSFEVIVAKNYEEASLFVSDIKDTLYEKMVAKLELTGEEKINFFDGDYEISIVRRKKDESF